MALQASVGSSILPRSTKYGDAATMVEWPRTVNPVLKKRNRFESLALHQITVDVTVRRLYTSNTERGPDGKAADC